MIWRDCRLNVIYGLMDFSDRERLLKCLWYLYSYIMSIILMVVVLTHLIRITLDCRHMSPGFWTFYTYYNWKRCESFLNLANDHKCVIILRVMNYKKFAQLVLNETLLWTKSHGTLTLGVMTVEDEVKYNKHVVAVFL